MDRYQKKPLKFSGYGRDVRSEVRNKERRTSRNEGYSTSRPLETCKDIQVPPVTTTSKIPGLKPPTASRQEMLMKWKEEKLKKKQLEERNKKPVFKPASYRSVTSAISSASSLSLNSTNSLKDSFLPSQSIRIPGKKVPVSKLPAVASTSSSRVALSKTSQEKKPSIPKLPEKVLKVPAVKTKPDSHKEETKIKVQSQLPKSIPKPVSRIASIKNEKPVASRIAKPMQVPTLKVTKPPLTRPVKPVPNAKISKAAASKDSTFNMEETKTEEPRIARKSFAPEEFQFSFSIPMDDPAQLFLDIADGRRSTPMKKEVTPVKQQADLNATNAELSCEKPDVQVSFAVALSFGDENNITANINIQRSPKSDSKSDEKLSNVTHEVSADTSSVIESTLTHSACAESDRSNSSAATAELEPTEKHGPPSKDKAEESLDEVTLGVKFLKFKSLPQPVFASRSSSECSAFGRTHFRSQLDSIVETKETPESTPEPTPKGKRALPAGFTPRRSARLSALKENQLPQQPVFTPLKGHLKENLKRTELVSTPDKSEKFISTRRSTRLSKLHSQSYEDLFDIDTELYSSPSPACETEFSFRKSNIADTPRRDTLASNGRVSLLYTPPRKGRISTVQSVDLGGNLMAFSPDIS